MNEETTGDPTLPGTCAQCGGAIPDTLEVFCGPECTQMRIAELNREFRKTHASRPEKDAVLTVSSSFDIPLWAHRQRWFYIVDSRQPDVACFGTREDGERCIEDGGKPTPISTEEGRLFERRVDAAAMWHTKRQRTDL